MTKPTTPPPSDLTQVVMTQLQAILAQGASPQALESALRLLAKWRSRLVTNTLERASGTKVMSGPFKGMDYSVRASEGSRAARLLGSYEASLIPVIEEVIRTNYRQVLDVGSAEGYYAVGLALRMPKARVWAQDSSETAQELCGELARMNGVEARVTVGGVVTHADFDRCLKKRTFVLCDIEGAEDQLLNPDLAPGLLKADILVECHDTFSPGLTDRIAARFAASHDIRRIGRVMPAVDLPDWMEALSDMDRLIALWEWRAGPTPWLWMVARTE